MLYFNQGFEIIDQKVPKAGQRMAEEAGRMQWKGRIRSREAVHGAGEKKRESGRDGISGVGCDLPQFTAAMPQQQTQPINKER